MFAPCCYQDEDALDDGSADVEVESPFLGGIGGAEVEFRVFAADGDEAAARHQAVAGEGEARYSVLSEG